MVTIRSATMRDVTFIAANMRGEDWREIHASGPVDNKGIAGAMCFAMSPGFAWTAWIGDDPVMAFGFARTGLPWLYTAWAFGTDRIRRTIPLVTRFGRETASRMLLEAGCQRCEIRSIADHDLAHRWLAGLGAHREAEMPDYGRGGETFVLYAWTRKDWEHVLLQDARYEPAAAEADAQP